MLNSIFNYRVKTKTVSLERHITNLFSLFNTKSCIERVQNKSIFINELTCDKYVHIEYKIEKMRETHLILKEKKQFMFELELDPITYLEKINVVVVNF